MQPQTFTELQLRRAGHCWSPGKGMETGKGRYSQPEKPSTPVRVKIKRLERKEKESSSPRDVNGAGRQQQQGRQTRKKVAIEKEKPARAIQTKINLYLSSTKAGKLDGAAEKFTKTTALRRDFPLGGFGSQGSKGALTPSRKPPSQHKVGRVLVGRRREEVKGQATDLDRWLDSGQDKQDTDPEPDPRRRQGSLR